MLLRTRTLIADPHQSPSLLLLQPRLLLAAGIHNLEAPGDVPKTGLKINQFTILSFSLYHVFFFPLGPLDYPLFSFPLPSIFPFPHFPRFIFTFFFFLSLNSFPSFISSCSCPRHLLLFFSSITPFPVFPLFILLHHP